MNVENNDLLEAVVRRAFHSRYREHHFSHTASPTTTTASKELRTLDAKQEKVFKI